MYPGVGLPENSSDAYIPDDGEFFWFYGSSAGTSVPAEFFVTASENANMGTEVTFTAQASELNCEENCIEGELFSFTLTIGLPFDDSLHEPLNLTADASENLINLSWDEPFTCPDGYFADCIGQCIEDWYEAWLGDGLCDDGTWGVYFSCEEFAYDNGDCDGGGGGGGNEDCEASGGVESWISDGWCDSSNNIDACGYDGGDCCPCTCVDSTYDCATYGGTCDACIVDGDAQSYVESTHVHGQQSPPS
jgi:hypothetical protein